MNTYEVEIRATITKSVVVDAINQDKAEEQAHEMFSVLNDDSDERYTQDVIGKTKLIVVAHETIEPDDYDSVRGMYE